MAGIDLSEPRYEINGLPKSIEDGDSYTPRGGENYVKFKGEDGSLATKTLSGSRTEFDTNFGTLTVTVQDAQGNPVTEDPVTIANDQYATDGQGQINLGFSGTATITALDGEKTKDVDVPGGGSAEATFQYAGLEGTVRTATNKPVVGATVTLRDSEGNIVATAETDDTGAYSFGAVPPQIDLDLEASPFIRSFTAPVSGDSVTKNLPFDLGSIASIEVSVRDAETGEPVVSELVELGDFKAKTDSQGVGRAATPDLGDLSVKIGRGKRYSPIVLEESVSEGEQVEIEAEIERKPAITEV